MPTQLIDILALRIEVLPGALVRAHAQIDNRIAIKISTPAPQILTVDITQAKMLLSTLEFAIRDVEREHEPQSS